MKHPLPLMILLLGFICFAPTFAGPTDNLEVRFALHVVDQPPSGRGVPVTEPCPVAGGSPGDGSSYDPNHYNHWTGAAGTVPCSQYSVQHPINEYPGPWVYIVVGQGGSGGIKGVSFGIDYKVGDGPLGANPVADPGLGQEILTTQGNYAMCTNGLAFPNDGGYGAFPAPRGGLRITWDTCQNQEVDPHGVHAVVAKFYVYAYTDDVLELTPNNNLASGPELQVADCGGSVTEFAGKHGGLPPSALDQILGKVQFGSGRDGLVGYTPCGGVDTEPISWGRVKTLFNGEGQ